jgi:hypothetical protein
MALVAFAESELRRAGLFEKDADYDGEIGPAVLDLVRKFASQGHSGFAAELALSAFDRVVRFKPLSALTTDPKEWMEVSTGIWQSRRLATVFSTDGGKTHYDLDERGRPVHNTQPAS